MALYDEYTLNKKKTLAENIDKAWEVYRDLSKPNKQRNLAQSFLIYALDISELEEINTQIIRLMADRNIHKKVNPEYIPGLSPQYLGLNPAKMLPKKTTVTNTSNDSAIQDLFNKQELIDVNQRDKDKDPLYTPYFNRERRAQYRVHIYKGQFYQRGKLFDTSKYFAHDKPMYAAYTLNATGELSVFKHYGKKGKPLHSSMNAGCPIVSAGELVIKKGELLAINTYSGHYQPNLFNVYRTLQYFHEKNINISNTFIYTRKKPSSVGFNVNFKPVLIPSSKLLYYKTSATEFIATVKDKLENSTRSICNDIRKYQEISFKNMLFALKDVLSFSNLTHERKALSAKLIVASQQFKKQLGDNLQYNKETINKLLTDLQILKIENQKISAVHGKDENNGRLQTKIDGFIAQISAIEIDDTYASEDELNSMKKIC